jgi:hypothetical protein
MASNRTYIVSYYAERNDDCVDFEIEIEAKDIPEAIEKINSEVRIFSRIFKVEEKPIGRQETPTDFERLNFPGFSGFPKVKEVLPKMEFRTNRKDENFENPLSALEKEY